MATHQIFLRDQEDPYAPPERVLQVQVVGERVFLQPMSVNEGFDYVEYNAIGDSWVLDGVELLSYLLTLGERQYALRD